MKTINNNEREDKRTPVEIENVNDLVGSLADMGAGAYLVETEEQAQELMESINNATLCIELEYADFETAKLRLDLDGHEVRHIWALVDGSAFLLCLPEDWD